MKKLKYILLFGVITACKTQKPNPIIGSWCHCQRDGVYKEFKITKNYTTTSVSDFAEHEWDDGISFFESKIEDSLLIITNGINVTLLNPPEIQSFRVISDNEITFSNRYGVYELNRLERPIPDIDSSALELWSKSYLDEFLKRARLSDCPDLRTEEEKNPSIEIGTIEDDFEDVKVIN